MTPEEIRKRAEELAEACGCRRWQTHRGMTIWQLEEEEKKR